MTCEFRKTSYLCIPVMRIELKKYSSLLLLILFLFPMVEKQAHAFEHSADTHCIASDKHFHEPEHHCDICDFTLTDTHHSADAGYRIIVSVQHFSFSSQLESLYISGAFQHLPARAPPVV